MATPREDDGSGRSARAWATVRRRVTPRGLARRLSAAGGRHVTAGQVEQLVARGAPVGIDGKVDQVAVMAWLVLELQKNAGDGPR